MGCFALSYYEQGLPPFAGRSVFLSTAKAAQRCPKGNENSCAGSYKFGFNGQEKVNEIAGIGNHTTALFWEYDTRIARRWNVDPKKKVWESDYSVLGLNPIINIDPLGDDWYKSKDGGTHYVDHKLSRKEMRAAGYKRYLGKEFSGQTQGGQGIMGYKDGSMALSDRLDEVAVSAGLSKEEADHRRSTNRQISNYREAAERGYMPFRADVMGVSIPFNFTFGAGASVSLNIAMGRGGIGLGITTAPNFGTPDASVGIGLFVAQSRPGSIPTVAEYLEGRGSATSIGLGPIALGYAQSVNSQGRPTFDTYSLNFAATSRLIPSPFSVGYNTAPVTYGKTIVIISSANKK